MATFTITTSVNIDTLTSKAGGDTYNINGGTLTIDQDSRYGLEQTTSTTLGNITVSATLGGSITFDASLVRLIPYNTGSGNVPASNTVISQGSASGKLIGVYSALNVAPTAVGAAMPASGYIKIKQWNSVAYAAGALTGIGATSTGADVVGWIEISADDAATITMPRLGNPSLKLAQGAWYQIGTTDGNRSTSYQIPSNGLLQYHGGVFVETGSGTGVYEFYPVSGETATAAKLGTDAIRGKFCYIATNGTLRFGNDGTNSTGGYVPPTGRKIVIGNIFFSCNTTAARTANVEPNATLATRYKFTTTGGGVIDMDKVSMSWYTRWTNAYSVNLTFCGFLTTIEPSNVATVVTLDRCGAGQHSSTAVYTATFNPLGCLVGVTATNCVFGHSPSISNGYCSQFFNCNNLTITGTKFLFSGVRTNTTAGSVSLANVSTAAFTSCTFNSRILQTNVSGTTFNTSTFYDPPGGNTLSANALPGFSFINAVNVLVDGLDFGGLTGVAPYVTFFSFNQSNSSTIRIRNIGTLSSPLDCGGPVVPNVSWTRVTTTATVTSTAHGLATGDTIGVFQCSATAPISLATKSITVIDANTFTFACSNTGATSGTLSYFLTITSVVLSFQNNTYASSIKFQRVYMTHFRSGGWIGANDNTEVTFDNCTIDADLFQSSTFPYNRTKLRSTLANIVRTAVTGVYGTIWEDYYIGRMVTTPSAQAWTRTTTTATVTTTNHNLRTNDLINVTVSSDETALALGQRTVTVLDKDTFTITATNAGSASGTLTYKPLNGIINIQMNESESNTSTYYTKDAGTPVFTSAGTLVMGTINDQVTWETPDWILGHLNFNVAEITTTGGTLTDYLVTYSIDTGSGYSSFKNLSRPITATGGASASTTISVGDTSNIAVGDYVFGTNVAPRAKVTSITNSTDFVVDKANVGVVSGILRFNQLPSEANNPSTGFKIKVRIKTLTTNTSALSALFFYTYSTATERGYNYLLDPLPYQSVTISGATAGSRIQLYDLTSGTELYNGTPTFPYTWTDSNYYVADREIRLRVAYVSGVTAKQYIETTIGTATSASPDLAYLVNQENDTVYNTNAVDGSAVTDITVSATRYSLIASRTMAQIYAFAMYTAFTETGIRDYGLAMSAVDTANYFIDEVLLKNTSSPTTPVSVTGGWVRDFDTGVALDLVDTTGGTLFLAPDHVVAYASASDYAQIADAVLDAAQSDHTAPGTIGQSIKKASKANLLL